MPAAPISSESSSLSGVRSSAPDGFAASAPPCSAAAAAPEAVAALLLMNPEACNKGGRIQALAGSCSQARASAAAVGVSVNVCVCVLIDQSGETPLHLFVNAYVNSLCLPCYERVSCLVRAACP